MAKKPELKVVPEPTAAELERARLMDMPLLQRNILTTARLKADGLPLHTLVPEDYRRMSVPEGLWGMQLKEVTASARPYIDKYEEHFQRCEVAGCGLYLWGKPGVGKTGAAVTVLKFARARFRTGFFITAAAYRDAVRHQHEFDADVLISERAKQVDMLVIDSLSKGDLNPFFTMDNVQTLVSDRGVAGRPTLITTTISERDMVVMAPDFFESVGKYLQTVEVTGPNRGNTQRDALGKLLGKKGD